MKIEIQGEQGEYPATTRYIDGIDGLRALAVLSVLLYHIDASLLPGGFVGVDLFFVISGFVVSLATSGTRTGHIGKLILAFYRRRVVRILPASLVAVVATGIVATLFVPVPGRVTTTDMSGVLAITGMSNIILWWQGGDYFSPGTELNPFTHTWSLGVEEQFYVIFPFFAFLIWFVAKRSVTRLALAGLALAALASLVIAAAVTNQTFAFYMLPARFWELAAGVLLYVAIRPRANVQRRAPAPWIVASLSVLGLALLIASFFLVRVDRFPFPGALPVVLAAVMLIYVVTVAPATPLARWLSLPPMRYIGQISFSLYLWHWPVIVLMRWTSGIDTVGQQLFAAGLSWALAHLSYRFVERRTRDSTWLARTSDVRVIAMGIAAMAVAGAVMVSLVLLRPAISRSATRDSAVWMPSPDYGASPQGCVATRDKGSPAAGVTTYGFERSGCAAPARAITIHVMGDSHAWGYQRMLSQAVRTTGDRVRLTTTPGCPALPGYAQADASADARCAAFNRDGLAKIARDAKSGDVVFLPGLRTPRYREYWEAEMASPPARTSYSDAAIDAQIAMLRPLLDKGVRVVLEAPKPVYRYAPLRCSDWFNRSNPHCAVPELTRSEAETQRAPVMAVYRRLQAREPRLEVWDPFGLLCPGAVCPAIQDGLPIVFDGDHLTGHANDVLLDPFLQLVRSPAPQR